MSLPKNIYYVQLEYGEGVKVGVYKKKGGKYTDYNQALGHLQSLRKRGIKCHLYATPTHWQEIEID